MSDGPVEVQRRKLAALCLDLCLDAIVLSDELGIEARTPSMKLFQSVLDKLDVTPREAIYLAEFPQGFPRRSTDGYADGACSRAF